MKRMLLIVPLLITQQSISKELDKSAILSIIKDASKVKKSKRGKVASSKKKKKTTASTQKRSATKVIRGKRYTETNTILPKIDSGIRGRNNQYKFLPYGELPKLTAASHVMPRTGMSLSQRFEQIKTSKSQKVQPQKKESVYVVKPKKKRKMITDPLKLLR